MQVPSGFSKSDSKLVWRFSIGINITDLSDECDGDLHFLHFSLMGRVYEQSLRLEMTSQMHQATPSGKKEIHIIQKEHHV